MLQQLHGPICMIEGQISTLRISEASQHHGCSRSLSPRQTSPSCSHSSREVRSVSCSAAVRSSYLHRSHHRAGTPTSCSSLARRCETWELSLVDFALRMGMRALERSEVTALGIAPSVPRPSVRLRIAGGILSAGWCMVCELLRCSLGGRGTARRVDPGISASVQCAACI